MTTANVLLAQMYDYHQANAEYERLLPIIGVGIFLVLLYVVIRIAVRK